MGSKHESVLNGLDPLANFGAPMPMRSPAPMQQQRTARADASGYGTSRTPIAADPRWVPSGTPTVSANNGNRDPFATISHDATPSYRAPSPMRWVVSSGGWCVVWAASAGVGARQIDCCPEERTHPAAACPTPRPPVSVTGTQQSACTQALETGVSARVRVGGRLSEQQHRRRSRGARAGDHRAQRGQRLWTLAFRCANSYTPLRSIICWRLRACTRQRLPCCAAACHAADLN